MKIHNHPQKTDYATPAEWPLIKAQQHWRPSTTVADQAIGHVHIEARIPLYAEITDPFEVSARLVLFKTSGYLLGIYNLEHQITNIIWEETGTSTPPVMRGDPNGEKSWNVKFTYDTTVGHPPNINYRGWGLIKIATRLLLDNGDKSDIYLMGAVYWHLGNDVPESPAPGEGRLIQVHCDPSTPRRQDLSPYGGIYGTVISEFIDMLPLGPIDKPWPVRLFTYNYAQLEGYTGSFRFPPGTFEVRVDPDLHHDIPGKLIASGTLPLKNTTPTDFIIDPVVIGPGLHKLGLFWILTDTQGNDITAFILVEVTVGPNIPPPPPDQTCQDPNATNFLGPLPCIYALPPVEEKRPIGNVFQQFINGVAQPHYYVSPSSGIFVEIQTK